MISLTTLMLIVGGVIIVVPSVGIWLFFRIRKGKAYDFRLHSRDGKTITSIKGFVKIDPKNKSNKRFFFKENDSSLEIREPSSFIDGKPSRDITYNNEGGFVYLEEIVLNTDKLEYALTPEEKQIALFRLRSFENRYESQLSKTQAVMLIANFILILLLLIGSIYAAVTSGETVKNSLVIVKELDSTISKLDETAKTNLLISEQQTNIMAMLAPNGTQIVRRLT